MPTLKELAKVVETPKLADSKGPELKGPNVRGPSLIAGQLYLGKTWKPTIEDSDNIFIVLKYIGAGNVKGETREMYAENPRLIDLKEGDRFFFERYQNGRNTEFGAYGADDCLCFLDPPVRLTFFQIVGVTDQAKQPKPSKGSAPAAAKSAAKAAPPAKGKKAAIVRKKGESEANTKEAEEPAAGTAEDTGEIVSSVVKDEEDIVNKSESDMQDVNDTEHTNEDREEIQSETKEHDDLAKDNDMDKELADHEHAQK